MVPATLRPVLGVTMNVVLLTAIPVTLTYPRIGGVLALALMRLLDMLLVLSLGRLAIAITVAPGSAIDRATRNGVG
jgi:hypothetical protein